MPLSTKRYFCGGCGAVVDGPGRYCQDACVAKARASVPARPLPAPTPVAPAGDRWGDIPEWPAPPRANLPAPKNPRPITGEFAPDPLNPTRCFLCGLTREFHPEPQRPPPDYAAAIREGIAAAEAINRAGAEVGKKFAAAVAPFSGMAAEFLGRYSVGPAGAREVDAGPRQFLGEPTRAPRRARSW
jgi:hypothetical protein